MRNVVVVFFFLFMRFSFFLLALISSAAMADDFSESSSRCKSILAQISALNQDDTRITLDSLVEDHMEHYRLMNVLDNPRHTVADTMLEFLQTDSGDPLFLMIAEKLIREIDFAVAPQRRDRGLRAKTQTALVRYVVAQSATLPHQNIAHLITSINEDIVATDPVLREYLIRQLIWEPQAPGSLTEILETPWKKALDHVFFESRYTMNDSEFALLLDSAEGHTSAVFNVPARLLVDWMRHGFISDHRTRDILKRIDSMGSLLSKALIEAIPSSSARTFKKEFSQLEASATGELRNLVRAKLLAAGDDRQLRILIEKLRTATTFRKLRVLANRIPTPSALGKRAEDIKMFYLVQIQNQNHQKYFELLDWQSPGWNLLWQDDLGRALIKRTTSALEENKNMAPIAARIGRVLHQPSLVKKALNVAVQSPDTDIKTDVLVYLKGAGGLGPYTFDLIELGLGVLENSSLKREQTVALHLLLHEFSPHDFTGSQYGRMVLLSEQLLKRDPETFKNQQENIAAFRRAGDFDAL